MDMLNSFVPVVIVILLVAVVCVLFTGLLTMAIGGRFTPEFRNKLMKTRVVIQGLILLMAVITFAATLIW